jgi:BirA family biotin operon repressor/biotin-[acetyl-CoA-carboxylase] ligase
MTAPAGIIASPPERRNGTPELLARLNAAAEGLWPVLSALWATRDAPTQMGGAATEMQDAALTLEVLPRIESTNSELMRRARAGHTEPTFLVAAEQTAGRGRMGKDWVSRAGDSLTFSVLLPMAPASWSGLSLAVGVSVAESLGALCSAPIQLKWPNDLWHQGRKLAGILVETAHAGPSRCVVVGVGINLATPELPPDHPGVAPLGLHTLHPGAGADNVWARVAPALLRDLLAFEQNGFAPFAERFARLDALAGQPLVLSDGTQGTGAGVDGEGALLLQTHQGLVTVHSNAVSVRHQSREAAC